LDTLTLLFDTTRARYNIVQDTYDYRLIGPRQSKVKNALTVTTMDLMISRNLCYIWDRYFRVIKDIQLTCYHYQASTLERWVHNIKINDDDESRISFLLLQTLEQWATWMSKKGNIKGSKSDTDIEYSYFGSLEDYDIVIDWSIPSSADGAEVLFTFIIIFTCRKGSGFNGYFLEHSLVFNSTTRL